MFPFASEDGIKIESGQSSLDFDNVLTGSTAYRVFL
jgi:hypothetical protein